MEELEGYNFLEALRHWLLPGFHLSVDMLTAWFVVILLTLVGALAMRRASVRPTGLQNAMELALEWLSDLSVKIMGHEGPRFLPFFATLFFFIVVSNLLGLVPGFKSPTSNLNLNAAMAILVALLTQFYKIKYQGFSGYLKHFCGPPYWLAPLFIPMRMIEELAR
ncbi:MAG: F0F1 ATP synthase subunit A, partial [Lentisphaerae bacterium]|nr:F0F1 ATP synthase subunit A [Lentisphaerota bacterium]